MVGRKLPLGQSEVMHFNALGQMDWKTDFNGETTTFQYDVRGRVTNKTPDASYAGTTGNEAVSWSYSPDELTRTATRGTTIQRKHDFIGQTSK